MLPKLILFTGAPEASSLNWEERNLLNTFGGSIARFVHLDDSEADTSTSITPSSAPSHPAWRSLPLDRRQLSTGISQDRGWAEEYLGAKFFATPYLHSAEALSQGAQFFAAPYLNSFKEELSQVPPSEDQSSSLQSVEQALSQFYEESYAIHRDVPSSQIEAITQAEISFITETSFATTESFSSLSRSAEQGREIPTAGNLTSLKDIPNATYLDSIHPQTMTVNLIIGIISNPGSRSIRTRWGANVELTELVVGDETKTGFGINFWLSSSQSYDQEGFGDTIRGLRPQDVVLVRNVALSSFRGKVFGQSLRKGMTKVHLLYRNRVDKSDLGGCYSSADLAAGESGGPQLQKTKRVREWVEKFVGVSVPQRKGKRRAEEAFREVLPPDSQSIL